MMIDSRSAKHIFRDAFIISVSALLAVQFHCGAAEKISEPYGLDLRPPAKAFLQMPGRADGTFPKLLSQTGAFKDTARLAPNDTLIPYDLIVPFWSDGAAKLRWISVPDGKIKF